MAIAASVSAIMTFCLGKETCCALRARMRYEQWRVAHHRTMDYEYTLQGAHAVDMHCLSFPLSGRRALFTVCLSGHKARSNQHRYRFSETVRPAQGRLYNIFGGSTGQHAMG